MTYVNRVAFVSPRRVEVFLNDGKEIVFVIGPKGKFGWASQSSGISKPAFQEACRAAGKEFNRQKNLLQFSAA